MQSLRLLLLLWGAINAVASARWFATIIKPEATMMLAQFQDGNRSIVAPYNSLAVTNIILRGGGGSAHEDEVETDSETDSDDDYEEDTDDEDTDEEDTDDEDTVDEVEDNERAVSRLTSKHERSGAIIRQNKSSTAIAVNFFGLVSLPGSLVNFFRCFSPFARALRWCSNTVTRVWTRFTTPKSRVVPFRHLEGERNDDEARRILQQLQTEFIPIIERRGYRVSMVGEYTDTRDANVEAFPRLKRHAPQNDEDGIELGYNTILTESSLMIPNGNHVVAQRTRQLPCFIGLRLRSTTNALFRFDSYANICEAMCHELAHCVHWNHSKEFFNLMDEIMREHARVVAEQQRSRPPRRRSNTKGQITIRKGKRGRRLGGPIKKKGLFSRFGRFFSR